MIVVRGPTRRAVITVKIAFIIALFTLFFVGINHADDANPTFLQPGHRYELVYALDLKSVGEQHLPTLVTFIGPAGGSWYVVKPLDRDTEYRININNVAVISELGK